MAEEDGKCAHIKKRRSGTYCCQDPVSTCLKGKKRKTESDWQKKTESVLTSKKGEVGPTAKQIQS